MKSAVTGHDGSGTVLPLPLWLQRYVERGFRLLFYPSRQKGPTGAEGVGWLDRPITAGDYQLGQNVGVVLGHEVKPGRFLADVDLDWGDGTPLARRLLPPTGFGFGRASRTVSHAFYTTSEPVTTKAFDNIDGKPFVELRGVKSDGLPGFQTMVPPSIHPCEEVLELRQDGEIAHDDSLPRKVALYATACMLLHHVGHRGLLHDARLAVAGFLLQLGLSEEETTAVGQAVADVTGNDAADMATAVHSTAQKLRRGERVNGRNALVKVIGDEGKKVVSRITEWFGGTVFILDRHDNPVRDNQENIRRALEQLQIELAYDMFSQQPIFKRNGGSLVLQDRERNDLWLEIEARFGFRPTADYFDVVLLSLAHQKEFHPVRDYLASLEWDGKPRLDTWLVKYGGAQDTEYTRATGAAVLIAAVRRVRQPGCKFDELLVLESEQGMLKSTALRALTPNDEWFSDDLPLNVDAKQIIERTVGKWIIEAAELSGMRPAHVEHLKSMLSRQVDGPVRLAYARMPVQYPRQFIVIGTTNAHAYLKDMTGNRRYWPIRVSRFNVDLLVKERNQLWAEAAKREASGESCRLAPKLYGAAAVQQEERHAIDPWEIVILEKIAKAPYDSIDKPGNKPHVGSVQWKRERFSVSELWDIVNVPIERRTVEGQQRLGVIMQRFGFHRVTVRRNGTVSLGWGRDVRLDDVSTDDSTEPDV